MPSVCLFYFFHSSSLEFHWNLRGPFVWKRLGELFCKFVYVPSSRCTAALMDSFLRRPKRKSIHVDATAKSEPALEDVEESTEIKLAMLSSLHPLVEQERLLDVLLAHDGSVSQASASLKSFRPGMKKNGTIGFQQSLRQYAKPSQDAPQSSPKKKTKKGSTLHLYDPKDVAENTPCTIIHNFLPAELADDLLYELLNEAKTFAPITFKLFENVVTSPHTSCLFLESYEKIQEQKHDYYYNGGMLDVSHFSPCISSYHKRHLTNFPTGCAPAHANTC